MERHECDSAQVTKLAEVEKELAETQRKLNVGKRGEWWHRAPPPPSLWLMLLLPQTPPALPPRTRWTLSWRLCAVRPSWILWSARSCTCTWPTCAETPSGSANWWSWRGPLRSPRCCPREPGPFYPQQHEMFTKVQISFLSVFTGICQSKRNLKRHYLYLEQWKGEINSNWRLAPLG